MGAVLNTAGAAEIAAELACCACSSVCGFLCKDHATRAKLRYCTLLFFATIMCFVMLVPGMRRNFDRIPNLCGKLVTGETCDKFFGFGAVYRIMLSMTTFYAIFAIFTIRITRIDSFRAKFNNGFWIVKFVILLGITIGTFFIPKKSEFFRIWMYACLIGGFIFMLYQIIIVIDFGHSWSVSWAERLETNNSKLWYLTMVLATLLMCMITLAAIATFYVLFAGTHALTKCKANTFYITFIVIQCFLAAVISVIPTVQQELAGAGLLQSSVVILYTSYLTFNTLSTEPDATCNPLGKVILDYDKMSGINGEALFGCLLSFALIIFACTVRAHTSQLGKYGLAISESEEYALLILMKEQNKKGKEKDGEQSEILLDDFVGYNYSLFHCVMALTSLHLLMILTNWHSPDQKLNMKRLVKNWASVWVQMASSFICILIYIWFLVTPLVRKIWAPLFGIAGYESARTDGYKQLKRHKSKFNLEKSQRSSTSNEAQCQRSDTEKVNKEENVREASVTSFERKENLELLNKANLDLSKSSGNLKRYKSIESLKSAVSSVMRRKNRTKNESERISSKEIDCCSERSKGTVLEEEQIEGSGVIGQQEEEAEKFREGERKGRRSLSRFGSMESLRSGFSILSNATKSVRRKLKTRLKRKEKTDERNETRNETDNRNKKDASVSRLEKSFDDRNAKAMVRTLANRTFDQSKSHDETRDSNDMRRRDGGLESDAINLRTSVAQGETRGNYVKHLLHSRGDAEIFKTYDTERNMGAAQNLRADSRGGGFTGADERPHSNTSNYGSSTFKEKPQDPEVAREILRLQWKILRMQAKVVKIQEKIIRIQSEDDVARRNAQEAVEQLEPPIGQSSAVAGGIYSKRIEVLESRRLKQNG